MHPKSNCSLAMKEAVLFILVCVEVWEAVFNVFDNAIGVGIWRGVVLSTPRELRSVILKGLGFMNSSFMQFHW